MTKKPVNSESASGRIGDRLKTALEAETVEVDDDSGLHAGHVGAGGGGHYRVRIVSRRFDGMSRLERHRAVYAALGEGFDVPIHALALRTLTPGEARAGA